jgi:hypothetical protein
MCLFLPSPALDNRKPALDGRQQHRVESGLRSPRSLVVEFLGLEDKPVSRLVVYPRDVKDDVARQFNCGYEATCAEVSPDRFLLLAAELDAPFFQDLADDPDAQSTGGFRFSLTELKGLTRTRTLNRLHSAGLLLRAVDLLPRGAARRELQRRLAIATP